jgi:hypothetical protein
MRQPTLTILAFFILWFSASVEIRGQGITPLSTRDHLEIQQLATRYAIALDTRGNDGNALADLFATDGELIGLRGSAKGRADLAALALRGIMSVERPVVNVSHFSMNHVTQPGAGGATGKEYVVLVHFGPDDRPGGEFSSIGGHYEDAYVKTPAGWRFKRREYIPAKPAARPQPAPASSTAAQASATTPQTSPSVIPLTADDYIAIRALANSAAYGLDTGADGRLNVRHYMSNHLIEAAPEGARGKVYVMVLDLGEGARPTVVAMGGHYEDVYVKTAAGWQIENRQFFRSKSAQTLKAEAEAAAHPAPTK